MALPKPDIFGASEVALQYFRDRVPLTKTEWEALSTQARQKAFTVANVAQADIIQQVLDSLVNAQEEGLSLKEWRDGITETLTAAWGGTVDNPPHRLAVIFRNNVQTASSHGRIRQMNHPDVVRLRPYRLFDAVSDKRVTDICKKRHRVLLPADDPWWESNTPPLHHQCRSRIRSLRKRQAMRKGGVNRPPPTAENPQDGFGDAPTTEPQLQVKPVDVPDNYDPELGAALTKKLGGT
jgi:SPP1 gp7 family putative phage head morphogenesis protein